MSNFLTRAITGALFVAILVGAIVWNVYATAGLFGLVTILALNEFYGLIASEKNSPQKAWGIVSCALIFSSIVGFHLEFLELKHLSVLLSIPIVSAVIELYRKHQNPAGNIAITVFGALYIGIPFALLIAMIPQSAGQPHVYFTLLGFFILMWTNDTGAYLSGRAFGRSKLFERISPKKTWEGTVGGIVLCIAVALSLDYLFTNANTPSTLSLTDWIAMALIVSVIGSFGDLVESMIKRSLNIKDSGSILPGHGGLLDRFDGVLLASPAVFVYLSLSS